MRKRWLGGYVHVEKSGKPLFIIEKEAHGRRYHLSTRCHTERAALAALARFEADPEAFKRDPLGKAARAEDGAVVLTPALALEFRDWLLTRERPATTKHANQMFHRLREWGEDLRGVDLRKATLAEHFKPALKRRGPAHAQRRIIAIKSFFSWLRKERSELGITKANDATQDLPVPQGSPEKRRRKKVVTQADVQKTLRKLKGAERDCLLLLASTGLHVTELERFIRDPESELAAGQGDVFAVLQVRHKSGDTTRVPITDKAVYAAALRLSGRQAVPRRLTGKIKAAAKAAGVEPFGPGVMRHSFATWSVKAGNSPETVAEFLGHRSKLTTLKWYVDLAVPTAVVRSPKFKL